MAIKKIPAGSFKTHCLSLMDEVQTKRETILIKKRGKPVAKLVPVDEEPDGIFGFLAGKGKITGHVIAPALSEEEWGDLQ